MPPLRLLDGFGIAGAPPASAKPLPAKGVAAPDSDHPAGLYGAAAAPRALNAFNRDMKLAPLDFASLRLRLTELAGPRPVDLRPPLLIGAFLLALADMLAMLWLGGRWRRQVGPAIAGSPCCSRSRRRRRPRRETASPHATSRPRSATSSLM